MGEILGYIFVVIDVVFLSDDMGVVISFDDGIIEGWLNIKELLFIVICFGVSCNMDFNV